MSDKSAADITWHIPRNAFYGVLGTILIAVVGDIIIDAKLNATLVAELTHLQQEFDEHQVIGAHTDADIRITRLEAFVETLIMEERESRKVLTDIRVLLETQ